MHIPNFFFAFPQGHPLRNHFFCPRRVPLPRLFCYFGRQGKGRRRVGVRFSDQLYYSKFVKNMHIPIFFFVFPGKDLLRSKFVAWEGFYHQNYCVILGGGARAEGRQGLGYWLIAFIKIHQNSSDIHLGIIFHQGQKRIHHSFPDAGRSGDDDARRSGTMERWEDERLSF